MWPRSQTKNKNGTAAGPFTEGCRAQGPPEAHRQNLPGPPRHLPSGLPTSPGHPPLSEAPSAQNLSARPSPKEPVQSPFGRPTRAQGLFGLAMMLRQPCLPRPYLAFESWARYPLALLEPLLVHMPSYVECLTGNKSSYKLHHPSIQQVSWRVERPRDHGRLC